MRSFVWDGSAVTQPKDWTDEVGTLGAVTSFGVDAFGELYVTAGKSVYKIVPVR